MLHVLQVHINRFHFNGKITYYILNCSDPEITSGLPDVYALCGYKAELSVTLNVDCEGAWFKDGEQVILIFNKHSTVSFFTLKCVLITQNVKFI